MINFIRKGLSLSTILLFIFSNSSKAQCTASLTANTTSAITISYTAWQTVPVATGGQKYIDFAAIAGNTYVFTCRPEVGGNATFDEELSVLTTANVADGGVFATSFVNSTTTAGAEILYWSPNSSGTYRVVISKTGCVNTTAASTLSYTGIPTTQNFALWLGFTSTSWNTTTFTNWARRAAAGYPTNTTVPANTDDVFMNTGNTVMPDAGDNSITCHDLTVQSGITLTLQHQNNSLAVYGNFTLNGTLKHIGVVYLYFYGTGKTISGTGNFYGGTVCPLRFTQGSSYTLGTLAGNTLRATHIYMDWTSGAGGTLSIGANKLSTQFFFQNGTFNQNTGILEISGPNDVTKAYAPVFAWASVNGTNPYIQGARFNAGTGTTYYNSGDFVNSDNFTLGNQQVSCGTGSAVTYYNLKIRTNNGYSVSIGTGTAFTVSNDLEIYNPGTAGGIAATLSDITLNGNFLLGNSGNALTLNLDHRIARASAGTGVFTMGNNAGHIVNVTYAHATNWAISLGAAGITAPLTFYGTVNYNSGSAQKVMSPNYYNLMITGSGSRTLTAATVVNGNLTNSGTLDVTASNFNITLAGNFTNTNTFTPQAHTFTFNGTTAQSITNTSSTITTFAGSVSTTIAIPDGTPSGGVAAGNAVPTAAALSGKGASLSIIAPTVAGNYISLNNISLNATHTFNSDLDIYLVSPDNTVFVLSTDNGGAGDGYLNVTFSDAGATVPPTAATNFSGVTYKPEGQTFSSYNGLYAGTWKLYVIDGSTSDAGNLTSFAMSLTSQSPAIPSTLNLYNLIINNSSTGVTTNNNISINSAAAVTLTSGNLDLNSNTLILNNTAAAAISGGSNSSYIISETNSAVNPSIIQWKMGAATGAHVYPFGVNGTYIPFTFNKTTAGAADISVSTRATAADNLPLAGLSSVAAVANMTSASGGSPTSSVIDRWWDITASAAVTGDLIFTYRGIENTMTVTPTGAIAAQHWNGTSWDSPVGAGTGVTAGTGTVSVTGASNFSPWILGASSKPLPIELLSFTGQKEGSKNKLEWKTAAELNNDYFTLERSEDAATFETLIKVPGAGNSLSKLTYNTYDNLPFNDITYYRLKQTDYDGKYTYSSVIAIENNSEEMSVNVYPNPTNNNLNLDFYTPVQGVAKILIYDYAGRVVINKEENITEGRSGLNTEMTALANGIYTLVFSFNNDQYRSITKIIKN